MTTTSPLAEVEVDSLSELMSRDPVQLRKTSDAEFSKLIEVLVAQRRAHEAGEKIAKAKKPKAKPKGTPAAQLTLDDLLSGD